MLRTLRARLIASHVLLLLITIPIVGVVLVYVLETQVLLVNLSQQLTGQAMLVAEMAREHPQVWQDKAASAAFVDRVARLFPAQLMLLTTDGRVLASSDPADAWQVGHPLGLPGPETATLGTPYVRLHYSRDTRAEVVDVMVRALDQGGSVAGVIRLTDQFAGVVSRFLRLRYLIAEVLAAGLILGSVVGLVLALQVERPLRQVTQAVTSLAAGHRLAALPEQGPAETRRLLRAVNSLVDRLHSLEEGRRLLLSNLIHELGRPLGALRAGVHALRSGAMADAGLRDELLEGIDGELLRLQHLVDDLAGLQDSLLRRLDLNREMIDLADWLPEVLSPWAQAAGQKGLRWETNLAPQLPCVPIDPDRFSQALGNLLSNAVKYTPPGGLVSVSAWVASGSFRVVVTDDGPGIAAAEQERIFEPFYRSPAVGRFQKGMGLGLGIARELVSAHGGSLSVESAPGAGCHFTVDLPLTRPESPRGPGSEPLRPPESTIRR